MHKELASIREVVWLTSTETLHRAESLLSRLGYFTTHRSDYSLTAQRPTTSASAPKDGFTTDHALEVARLSRLVGMELGMSEDELEWLVHGALLHDLGKLGVADEILGKPSTLSEEEWALVKRHSEIGVRMIEPLEILSRAVPVVRHHHEHLDGTGYPDGLEREEIPLAARIVAAVDAYDVMLRRRHYRPQRDRPRSSPAEALKELWSEAGRQFDVRVVEAMGRVLGDPKTSTDSPRTL